MESLLAWSLGWQEIAILAIVPLIAITVVLIVVLTQKKGPGPAPMRRCGNCGRAIGHMEQTGVVEDRIVCLQCDQVLRSQQAGAPPNQAG